MKLYVIKTKIYLLIICLLLVLLIIIAMKPISIISDSYTYSRVYQLDIKTFKLAFDIYRGDNDIPEYLLNKSGEKLNRALLKILTDTCTNKQYNTYSIIYYNPRRKSTSSSGAFVDPWGTPYCFRIYNDTASSTGDINNVFLMWSCGSNRINDYGTKDDINSWESYEENSRRIKLFKLLSNIKNALLL